MQITAQPEGKEKGAEEIFEVIKAEISPINDKHQTTDLGSSESAICR